MSPNFQAAGARLSLDVPTTVNSRDIASVPFIIFRKTECGQLQSKGQSRPMHRPAGLTFLSIWQFLTGVILVLYAVGMLNVSSYARTEEGQQKFSGLSVKFAEIASTFFFIVGMMLLVLGLSALLLSRGYYMGHESARRRGRAVAILAIVVAFLGSVFLPERLAPDSPGWTILFNAIAFVYLGRPGVKAFFAAHAGR